MKFWIKVGVVVLVVFAIRECAQLVMWRRYLSDAQARTEANQTAAINRLHIRVNQLEAKEGK